MGYKVGDSGHTNQGNVAILQTELNLKVAGNKKTFFGKVMMSSAVI